MRSMLVAAALAVALAGCTSAHPEAGRTDDGAQESRDTSIGAALAPDDPAVPHDDVTGRTPDDVVIELVAARNSGNWEAAYALYAAPEVDFATAAGEWSEADEYLRDFTVREIRVSDQDTAFVRVTYSADTSVPVAVSEPGEWWTLDRIDGAWRVKWMPRQ